ncbi:MAG: hypothetical protein ABI972_24500 [Acidobacteriota bacterium]
MSQTIQISEKSAELLARQAAAHGVTVEAWVEKLAIEKANSAAASAEHRNDENPGVGSVVEQMRKLRSRVKPDPEGWTVKDYVEYGRR